MEVTIHLRHPNPAGVRLELWHQHDYRFSPQRFDPVARDEDGIVFKPRNGLSSFHFKFLNLPGDPGMERFYAGYLGQEVWCLPERAEVYAVRPATARGHIDQFYQRIQHLVPEGLYLPETDVAYLRDGIPPAPGKRPGLQKSLLGANVLRDGSILFGLFHPRAAQVFLVGNFNNWQCPGHSDPRPEQFLPLELYRGYYDLPNLWVYHYQPRQPLEELEYQFFVMGGVPLEDGSRRPQKYLHDPLTRCYGPDITTNPCRVVDPTRYHWRSVDWQTPDIADLIIYEMNIYGFTEGDADIPAAEQGKFQGVIRRIRNGFFKELGVTALGFMPTSEAPSMQGPTALGYDPCGFAAIERDFGTPDDLRELVDTAHGHGLAILMDLVFNHTANSFNPLWDSILDGNPGGFYFSGSTPWGNKVATEREEVQNFLIDVCKLLLKEYRVDGFRFDATHSDWMDHNFLRHLEYEIRGRGFKPDAILIVENLPNQPDLNLQGWNGFAQWCDPFHDKMKALLREGVYQDWVTNNPEHLGDVFYYCRNFYAAHTNNVINYCESHDENSMAYEVATDGPALQTEPAKERKARLGLMATIMALGQPMIYMGQEFGVDRPRNRVQFEWPSDLKKHSFYQWASHLIQLRRRYPGLKLSGSDLIGEGRFQFIAGPWLERGKGRLVIGWRVKPSEVPYEQLVVLFNFEPYDVDLEIDFGTPGLWAKLADIDRVNDLPPLGTNSPEAPETITTAGLFPHFTLPSSSGFVYKWVQ
ncbi:1,4-alpha-glucan branching enzyme [Hydrogenispora ethanolica]|jgi:1,4-alpha-glucan branching enzyme|uniref:1,4-alpha-glucan branching enzyme n=1 Tax=Hydrogenispora ethanolica TaxID=1082276 RepID=A0A4R1RW91_HYDET|nr:alpha-amylase family glycosyl hydrolase [Hydrogenispora ethanolica]TCL70945.1 1,4-alpha-glucan branching enzyme [Hydrogenispora ethanolica]